MAEKQNIEDIDPIELIEAAQNAIDEGALDEAARLFNTAGNIYMSVAEYEEALEAFENALRFYREIKDSSGEGDALYNIGVAFINLERWEKAVKNCNEAVNLFKKQANPEGHADALYGLALAKLGAGEFEEGISLLKKVQKEYLALENKQGAATAIMDMGNAYADKEDWLNAEKAFKKALKIFQEIDDPSGIADAFSLLGDIAEINNNQKKSAEYFVAAAEQYIRADMMDIAREVVERAESKLWDIPKATRRRLRKRIDDIIDVLPEETTPEDDEEFNEDELLDFEDLE